MSRKRVKKTGFGEIGESFGLRQITTCNGDFTELNDVEVKRDNYPSRIDYASDIERMQNL